MKKLTWLIAIGFVLSSSYAFASSCKANKCARDKRVNACVKYCMKKGMSEELEDCIVACEREIDAGTNYRKSTRYPF